MINIHIDEDRLILEIDGHAGFAPAGQDIVCAGVSSLVMAIVDTWVDEDIACNIEYSDGYCRIHCLEESERYLFHAICIGLEHIAHDYPDNVTIGGYDNGRREEG